MARRMRALTSDRVGDLPDPCSSCALWETGGREAPVCEPAVQRERFERWIDGVRAEWGECGRIAYENREPLGFVKYAPPRFFPQAISMPSGPPDPASVLIACVHAVPEARDDGLGKVLLQAALRDLVSRGEKVVEAYAATDAVDTERSPLMAVEFLLRQGFTVARPHAIYPLMRLELKSLATWTDNIEAVLDALQLPRVRERVPATLVNPADTNGSSG